MTQKLYTRLETMEGMLIEAKNELTKCEVMDRMLQRQKLRGQFTTGAMNADGMNRNRISTLKATIADLEDVIKEGDNGVTGEPIIALD